MGQLSQGTQSVMIGFRGLYIRLTAISAVEVLGTIPMGNFLHRTQFGPLGAWYTLERLAWLGLQAQALF